MDYAFIILGIILMTAGILGAAIPMLPGPPLSFAGLLLLHFTEGHRFSYGFLAGWAVVVVLISVMDYAIPVWGAKWYGASKRGMWGAVFGLLAGFVFFPPFGIILGPFLGAVLGELTASKNAGRALRTGFGSFIGFLAGTLIKVVVSGLMAWRFMMELFSA